MLLKAYFFIQLRDDDSYFFLTVMILFLIRSIDEMDGDDYSFFWGVELKRQNPNGPTPLPNGLYHASSLSC